MNQSPFQSREFKSFFSVLGAKSEKQLSKFGFIFVARRDQEMDHSHYDALLNFHRKRKNFQKKF